MSENEANDDARPPAGQAYDDATLPEQTSDDTDVGWGDDQQPESGDERLLREKPPHW